jgi:hypothetical protein
MIIYLYVKTHKKTGLKYLGKTTKDPHKYLGSGIDWIKHLKKYGKDIHTEIIKECSSNEELNIWGRYYSKLWNIVNGQDDFGNKIWANIIPETGGSYMEGNKQTPEHISKRVEKNTGKKRTIEFKENRKGEKNHFYNRKHSEKTIQKMKDNHADVSGKNNPMFGKIHPNKGIKRIWEWDEESKSKLRGEKNPMFGKTSPNKGKTPEKFVCFHCNLRVSKGNLIRWHGDNCKSLNKQQVKD